MRLASSPASGTPASVKIGKEQYAVTTDPDQMLDLVSAEEPMTAYRQHAETWLTGLAPDVIRSSACAYTFAPNGDFAPHGEAGSIVHVSACSGRSFRHSATLGEALPEQCLAGSSALDLHAFGLAR